MIYDFIKDSIENVYNNKSNKAKERYEKTIKELEIERQFLTFIFEDIKKNCPLGTKFDNKVLYKTNKILKKLSISIQDSPCLLESNCAETLSGFGINCEKDYESITIYLDN